MVKVIQTKSKIIKSFKLQRLKGICSLRLSLVCVSLSLVLVSIDSFSVFDLPNAHAQRSPREAETISTRLIQDARSYYNNLEMEPMDEALEQIRLALTSSPTNVECRIVEADLLLFQRDAEEAYAVLKPLYPTHANRRDFLGSLARAAAMSGRREEARRYQQKIVRITEGQANNVNPTPPVPKASPIGVRP